MLREIRRGGTIKGNYVRYRVTVLESNDYVAWLKATKPKGYEIPDEDDINAVLDRMAPEEAQNIKYIILIPPRKNKDAPAVYRKEENKKSVLLIAPLHC